MNWEGNSEGVEVGDGENEMYWSGYVIPSWVKGVGLMLWEAYISREGTDRRGYSGRTRSNQQSRRSEFGTVPITHGH
jgi:hypothetical protein